MPLPKVIDSWAMVAWIQDEPGGRALETFLLKADTGKLQLLMNWYNVAETFLHSCQAQEASHRRRIPYAAAVFAGPVDGVITGDQEIRRSKLVPVDWVGA